MQRVIEGFTRAGTAGIAAASASQEEDDVLVGTLELPVEARQQEVSDDEERNRLEQAARSSILSRGHAAQPSAACFDLRGVFRSLGATGRPEVLRTADLQAALARVSREGAGSGIVAGGLSESGPAVSFPTNDDTLATDAAADHVAARIVGSGGSLDFRGFEDWLMPPRGLAELRSILIDLVEEGSALGLAPAELFLQFCGGQDKGNQSDGVGRRALQGGLRALSVHLTETEVGTVMVGAGCGTDNDDPRMTLKLFSALLKNPPEPRQVLALSALKPTDEGGSAVIATAVVAAQSSATKSVEIRSAMPERREDGRNGRLVEGEGLTPDSLAPVSLPNMPSSSKLECAGEGDGDDTGPGSGSNSAAAHVEAFGRVAADVQAVLATAVSSGSGNGGGGGSGGDEGEFVNRGSGTTGGSFQPSTNIGAEPGPTSDSNRELRRTQGDGEAAQPPTRPGAAAAAAAAAAAGGGSGPVPRTRAITPPLGPARSPSEPLHPTRASRERLKAALENLDLKECLRPATGGDDRAVNAARLPSASRREVSVAFTRSEPPRSPTRVTSAAAGRTKQVEQGVMGSVLSVRPGDGGGRSGDGVATTTRRRRVAADVDRKGLRASRRHLSYGVEVGGGDYGGADRSEEGRRLGGGAVAAGVDREGDDSASDDSRNAPEVIGRLRARVAELELTEQLLRCELEAARTDLATEGRRAADEATEEREKARDRERALQAKMGARLRAAQAEVAATERRMTEQKRTSVAEAISREKSSAEYLRRRLKEAEAAFEAKAARLSAKQRKHSSGRRLSIARRGKHGMDENGMNGHGMDGTSSNGGNSYGVGSGGVRNGDRRRWAERPGKNNRALGGAGVGDDDDNDENRLCIHELEACRKKLVIATAEASRLRKQVAASKGAEREKGEGGKEQGRRTASEGERAPVSENPFCVCGEQILSGSGGTKKTIVLVPSHERQGQRQRERRLEARLAESEDARIEVEAEAGRLQAFLDEMKGLGPPVVRGWRGQGAAAE